jgi:hypothetical protein
MRIEREKEKKACNPSTWFSRTHCFDFGHELWPWLAKDPATTLVGLQQPQNSGGWDNPRSWPDDFWLR